MKQIATREEGIKKPEKVTKWGAQIIAIGYKLSRFKVITKLLSESTRAAG